MNLQFSESDLRELVAPIVREALAQRDALDHRLNGRIAYPEPEAAELVGLAKHQLRDARLRGEVKASRIGRTTLYAREELVRMLERMELSDA